MVVVSTGTFATRFNAFVAVVVGGRFFVAAGFVALMPARRTLDFAFFGVARFAAFFLAGLAFAFPRFKLFVRAETRFLVLAMAVSCEVCRRQTIPRQVNYVAIFFQRFATRFHIKLNSRPGARHP